MFILNIGIINNNKANGENPEETVHKKPSHLDFPLFVNVCPNLMFEVT